MKMVRRVSHGNLDQGFNYFKYAGMQCTCIALFTIASSFISSYLDDENVFDQRRMDSFIFGGNKVYTAIIDDMYCQQPPIIMPCKIRGVKNDVNVFTI